MTTHMKDTSPRAAQHPVPPSGEGDALWYAKAALADFKDHDPATVIEACHTVIDHDPDRQAVQDAKAMLLQLEKETTCQMAGG